MSAVARSVSPLIAARAAGLRQSLTFSEQQLWRWLSGRKQGVAFKRQVPVGGYIADFLAPSARLVVEVDGGYHARRMRVDARRDERLARLGYRVLRLPAELVSHNPAEAVARIRAALVPP